MIKSFIVVALLLITCHAQYIQIGQIWVDGDAERANDPSLKSILFETESKPYVIGLKMFRDYINNKGGIEINDTKYYVNITLFNLGVIPSIGDADLSKLMVKVKTWFLENRWIHAWVGPYSTTLNNYTAKVADDTKTLMLSVASSDPMIVKCIGELMNEGLQPDCDLDGERRFQYVFSTIPYLDDYAYDTIRLVHTSQGIKTVAFFNLNERYSTGIVESGKKTINELGIKQIASIPLDYSGNFTDARMDDLVLKLKYMNPQPDLVFAGNQPSMCEPFLRRMKFNAYTPKALIMYCLQDNLHPSPYVVTFGYFSCELNGLFYTDTEFNLTAKSFCNILSKNYSGNPNTGVAGFNAGKYIVDAARRAQSLKVEDIKSKIETISLSTVLGKISFDAWGGIILKQSIIAFQYSKNNSLNILSPVQISNSTLIYPMPSWDDRRPPDQNYKSSEIVIFFFSVLVMVYIIIILVGVAVLHYRNSYIISAATPEFLYFICIGLLLCLCSVFFWRLDATDNNICNLRLLTLSIGFIFFFGAIFVKTLRIAVLFATVDTLKKISWTIRDSFMLFSALVLIDLILLLIIFFVAPYEIVTISPMGVDYPFYNYNDCVHKRNQSLGETVIFTLMGYKIVLVFIATISTFIIRKVKYLHINESKWIAYTVYNILFCFIPIVIVQFLDISNEVKFIIRSVFVIFICSSSASLMFIHKFYYRYRGKDTTRRVKHGNDCNTSVRTGPKSALSTEFKSNGSESAMSLEQKLKSVNDRIRKYATKMKVMKKLEAKYLEKIIVERKNV